MKRHIHLNDLKLSVSSGCFTRTWKLNSMGAVTASVQICDHSLPLSEKAGQESECYFDGLGRLFMYREKAEFPPLQLKKRLPWKKVKGDCFEGGHERMRLVWQEPVQGMSLARSWLVYPGASAIVTMAEISSESAPQTEFGFDPGKTENVIDSLPLNLVGWHVQLISVSGRSDHSNDLIQEQTLTIGKNSAPVELRGQFLFLNPPEGGCGLFVLHESPPVDEKRLECQVDFRIGPQGVQILGWGIASAEVLHDRLRASYTVAVGGYAGGEFERLCAVRTFMKARYPSKPALATVVANPWGDGCCYKNLGERFVLGELEACATMGITHYQIDDGWQVGGVLGDLCIRNMSRSESFWDIHPDKFPCGFAPLVKRARELGVSLSLWFAPDANRQYRNWREESDLLLKIYRQYGISLFKIDAVWIRTKQAEENLLAFLKRTIQKSGGKIAFNLDVTAGRRLGHFSMLRYGNIFIENRYVRSADEPLYPNTYLPWRVLRNLWSLSRYLPPERLQFEVPNCHKPFFKTDQEIAKAFNMAEYHDDYLAAITLMSSPLCWFEPSLLEPETKQEIRRIISLHHGIRGELNRSCILPLGEEPSGRSWTGFQAFNPAQPTRGLLLVFRENTSRSQYHFNLWGAKADSLIELECISHNEALRGEQSARNLPVQILRSNDFRLYRYNWK